MKSLNRFVKSLEQFLLWDVSKFVMTSDDANDSVASDAGVGQAKVKLASDWRTAYQQNSVDTNSLTKQTTSSGT